VSAYGLFSAAWGTSPDIEMHAMKTNPHVAGEYVWTGFDYLGEPTPYNQDASNIGNFIGASEAEKKAAMEQLKAMGNKAPSRSSYFGLIDLAGFPKDIYYLYQSQWNPGKKMAHILPHWNWAGREGQKTPVMVFTSGDEAELFVNGKSQGVRRRGEGPTFTQKDKSLVVSKNQYRFTWEDVVYEPGTVEVVVKKDGQPWATAKRETTGASAAVTAQVDRSAIANDGHDLSYISLALTDAKGNVVPTDSRKVSFSIEGPAVLAGFCNGNPIDHTSLQNPKQQFFNGRILAVVRGKRGESGTATVTVKAEGLPEIKVPVHVASSEQ
jgi:beta-galactosidase